MSRAFTIIKGAAAFGIHLSADGDDLAYYADYAVPPSTLERIDARRDELIAELRTRREEIAAIWPELKDFKTEEYQAFRDATIERILVLQDAFDTMERAAAVVLPEIRRNGGTWDQAVERLLAQPVNQRYASRRSKGYSDAEWLGALYRGRPLEEKGPPVHRPVAS